MVLYSLNDTAKSEDSDDLDQIQWVYVCCLALPLSGLFAFCLRFDFSNHVDAAGSTALEALPVPANSTTPAHCRLEALTAPLISSLLAHPQLGAKLGVISPSYAAILAVRFPSPYFGSALAVWLCANLVVFMLGLRGFATEYGPEAHACGVLLLAPPFIVGTTIAVALARGEIRRLLYYEEVWTYEPVSQGGLRKIWPL